MSFGKTTGTLLAAILAAASASAAGCGSSNGTTPPRTDGGSKSDSPQSGGCTTPADDDYAGCATCTVSSTADPATCSTLRSVNACCAWVTAPTGQLTRAIGLHDYSSSSGTTVDYSCLTTPPTAGTVQTVTLSGFVKIFSSGTDTAGVDVAVYNVDPTTGALGAQIGSTFTTTTNPALPTETNTWLNACTTTPCTFRQYVISGVPTETPLVIKTSDSGGGVWNSLYDYYVYFSDADDCSSAPTGAPCVQMSDSGALEASYDVTTVNNNDIAAAASAAGGYQVDPSKGLLAGEVHDCGDIRVSGATVDTDQAHLGSMLYFGAMESDPLPNASLTSTSVLGLYGAFNYTTGVPIRVSALGLLGGADTLLGTAVVQAYPGPSVTAITLRGRRAFQSSP